ncbi:hypothetical protein BGE01nite_21790 [Brevifollis gellanilyticus]|uniref:Uncharacterized protein n=2 Tax=Brevifollis gellanilyticus TaxID=748831 RepID=A0A512M833_9BACT|nr:hypothetical protein BGE01nite_21790 [Brevifollis gellanilyticus]
MTSWLDFAWSREFAASPPRNSAALAHTAQRGHSKDKPAKPKPATDHDMKKLPFESLPSVSELFDHARTLVKEGKVEGRDAQGLARDIITDAVHDWPELNKNALINKLRKMLVIIHRREDGTPDSFEGVILNPHNSQSYPVWVKGLDGTEWKGTYHKNQDPQVTHLERIEPAPPHQP